MPSIVNSLLSCLPCHPTFDSSSSSSEHPGRKTAADSTASRPVPRRATRTVSRCASQTARGTHAFEIAGYSQHKGIGAGKFIRSATFDVGGYDWCIRYYPDGVIGEDCKEYIAVFLELRSNKAEVRARYDLRLINLADQSSSSVFSSPSTPTLFNTVDISKHIHILGHRKFKKRSDLESSAYLRDDRLVIECEVTVIKGFTVVDTSTPVVDEPPPTLSQDLGNLLGRKEGADVIFKVDGEILTAHTIVLAMRSSVFMAEFYGPLSRPRGQHLITIDDIQSDVFRAFLYFIYTDTMFPGMGDLDKGEKIELTKHLLVAADQYDVPRLKSLCERNLSEILDVETVTAMTILADQYNCSMLKHACIEFINSTDTIFEKVMASKGYGNLKSSCPAILVDVFENAKKSRRI
ncbi:hypothetical protein ACP70R_003282 [Stipagrostis hirtigluma subsp. patula]